ncbi:MAG: sulfatase-like hydrolase/transferase [Bryobacterales bacterium]|nr:sulfatase-like hydrolase/transferase [Bryobacterales bacterium]
MRHAIAVCLLGISLAGADASEGRPNVVFLMADDVGYECFGAYGSRQYSTPRLNRLADGGVRFTNCYSTPLCTPSRVALMTGMSNVRNYADFGSLLPDQYTIADLFRDAGYATAVAGKWQLQGSQNAPGVPCPCPISHERGSC